MKKTVAFLLLAAFTLQSFNNTFIVLGFYINQKKIAATLCENRYRPMLHCDGKCQLAKKIKQEESKNNQNPERKLESKNEIFSLPSFLSGNIEIANLHDHHFPFYSENELAGIGLSVFHPPCS